MGLRAIFFIILLIAPLIARAGSPEPRVLQDPKTKVVFYLESDLHHIAAISLEGKLLWCTTVPPSAQLRIESFKLSPQGSIDVDLEGSGSGQAIIDEKTGQIVIVDVL
jgi:hypothetical protein